MKHRRYMLLLVPVFVLFFQAITFSNSPAATPEPNNPADQTAVFLPFTIRNRMSQPTTTPSPTTPAPTPTTPAPTTPAPTTPAPTTPAPTTPAPTTPPPPSNAIVVDHNSVALFNQIPANYLTAARNLRLMYSDRSVGNDLNNYLNCLPASSWGTSDSACRRDYYSGWSWKTFTQTDLDAGTVPSRILFTPNPVTYSRANWTFEYRQGTWSQLTGEFINTLAPSYLANKDVLTYWFSYLNVMDTDDIADPSIGFFSNNPNRYDVNDLEAFLAQHPDKVFFYWTTSLARNIGNQVSTDFNNQMRQYVLANDKILFDAADILSHTPSGQPCYDNRDGVQYCSQAGACENHPDDGVNYPAICQDYTTETDGGHLGSVSPGGLQLAKAYWVLMARIAGWNPGQ